MLASTTAIPASQTDSDSIVWLPGKVTVCLPEALYHQQQLFDCLCTFSGIHILLYKSFTKTYWKNLQKGRSIVLVPFEDFRKVKDVFATPKGLKVGDRAQPGEVTQSRLLLLMQEKDLQNAPLLPNVDVLSHQPSPQMLRYKISKALQDLERDIEVMSLVSQVESEQSSVNVLNEVGIALSTTKEINTLLELILVKCRQITCADAGTLYLVEETSNVPVRSNDYFSNKKMRFQVAQNFSRDIPFQSFLIDIKKTSIYGYVAITQKPLNLDNVYEMPKDSPVSWGGKDFDRSIDYHTSSILTVPMVNWQGQTIGVIQLINRKKSAKTKLKTKDSFAKHVRPFSAVDVQMAVSIASQASIALQNTHLVEAIRTLFEGFIDASVKAIESRDPTTSGHSQRVANLTVRLAERVDATSAKPYAKLKFSTEELNEIRYASLLHDFGKIGVREHVLIKAKKLYPNEIERLKDRVKLMRTSTALHYTKERALWLEKYVKNPCEENPTAILKAQEQKMQKALAQYDEMLAFILKCNEPTILQQGGFERLQDLAKISAYTEQNETIHLLENPEIVALSVPKGSLTVEERKEIESHVSHTYRFLSKIPWTTNLHRVPDIAHAHHEKLNGCGYPLGLTAKEIPVESKMMTIADIYDALTALDRPYKKALPPERALNILVEEANAAHVDKDLLDVFIVGKVYEYANQNV